MAPLSYLATDGQGTVSETLDSSGAVTSAQLYTPHGNVRYSSGSSPTSLGYTGQRADSATGLDYYQARYYDPVAGQFISADTVDDGLNRYGYVKGNPTTATDPSGHRIDCSVSMCGGQLGSTPPPVPTPTHTSGGCRSDTTCGCYTLCGGNNGDVGDCNPAAGSGGAAGGFSLAFSCGGGRKQTRDGEGVPNDALWGDTDPQKRFTMWLSYPEEDEYGWHLNLHVRQYKNNNDLHNFHIYFIGESMWDLGQFEWRVHDFVEEKGVVKIDSTNKDISSASWQEVPAAQQVAEGMQGFILNQAVEEMGDEPTRIFEKSGMKTALAEGLKLLTEHPATPR